MHATKTRARDIFGHCFHFNELRLSTLIRYVCVLVLIHFHGRFQFNAVSTKALSVSVWTEGLKASKLTHFRMKTHYCGELGAKNANLIFSELSIVTYCCFRSDFELLVMLNGRLSPSSGLYSRQTVLPLSIDTLNVMSVVHLNKWDSLAVAVRSDNPFQVLEDSTFSVTMHGRFTESREKIHLKRFIPEGREYFLIKAIEIYAAPLESGEWFSRELPACMNVLVVSIPNE